MRIHTLYHGVQVVSIGDERYKTARISVNFVMPLAEKSAPANALLPSLLTRCCEKYPDFTTFNRRLSMLYGASVSGFVRKMGEAQVMTASISMLDDRYVPGGEALARACAELLCEMIFRPAKSGGVFREEDVEQERRQLLEEIDAEFNDKRIYAKSRCEQILCEGEAYGISRYGTREAVAAQTAASLYTAWQAMLRRAWVCIYVTGAVDAEAVDEVFAREFAGWQGEERVLPETKTGIVPAAVKEVTERFDVAQAKLVMGFRCGAKQPHGHAMAARLFSALYGGTPHSRLFMNVRERLSLCYYCSARYDRNKDLLFVESGVEESNAQAAKEEILRQLACVQNGEFTQEELEAARLSMADSFGTVADSPAYLESWYLSQLFDGRQNTPEEAKEELNRVTRQEVVQAAGSVRLDTVYLLAGAQQETGGNGKREDGE